MPATRRQSSAPPRFTPMARASSARPIEVTDEETAGERQRDTIRAGERPLTRFGLPDRRFKGQRELEHPNLVNPDYIQPRQGGEENGRHVTLDGKPDRRFKENRALSDEEVMEQWAETIIARHGPSSKTRKQ